MWAGSQLSQAEYGSFIGASETQNQSGKLETFGLQIWATVEFKVKYI